MKKRSRRYRMESLEERQVLSAAPIVEPVLLAHTSDLGNVAVVSAEEDAAIQEDITLHNGPPSRNFAKDFTADFNGDGVTDFLGHDSNSWLLQVNDGTQLFTIEWAERGVDGEVVGVGDITNNGKLDAVIVDRSSGDIYVLANEGNSATEVLWGQMNQLGLDSHIFVDDYSGDGLVDVIVGNVGDSWVLAENNGTGFTNERYSDFPDFDWADVVTGDFSGDNVGDIAVRGFDQTWWVWFGKDGGFDAAKYWGHWKMRDTWHDVSVGDFTNDGRDDLIGRTEDGRLWVAAATDTRFHSWTWSKGWVERANWSNVAIVDIDGDGKPDQVGKDKKDRWWFAHNVGDRFQNYFWLQSPDSDNFEVVEHVKLTDAVDVIDSLPDAGFDPREANVQITLNDSNQLVLSGIASLVGLQLSSESGALIPSTDFDPFIGSLTNTSNSITLIAAIGGAGFELNESTVLNVGADPDIDDLMAEYGIPGSSHPVPVFVSDLGPSVTARLNVSYYDSSVS